MLPGASEKLTEPGAGSPLVARLGFFKMRSKVEIKVENELGVLAVVGPDAQKLLSQFFVDFPGAALEPGATSVPEPGVLLWRDPRHSKFGHSS